MRQALWVDLREPGQEPRLLLFDASAPADKREREAQLEAAVERVWPRAQLLSYGGGVAEFKVGTGIAVAHFGPVRDGAELLPLQRVLPLRDDGKRHAASGTESLAGSNLQLSLL